MNVNRQNIFRGGKAAAGTDIIRDRGRQGGKWEETEAEKESEIQNSVCRWP